MSLLAKLAANVVDLTPEDPPLSASAERYKAKGQRFCSLHQRMEPIDQFRFVIRYGKRYYRSSCTKADAERKKESTRKKGVPSRELSVKLTAARNRAKKIAKGGINSDWRVGWKMEERAHMLTVLPEIFDRRLAADIWGMTTKNGAIRYIRALLDDGAITVYASPGGSVLEQYRKVAA